MDELLHTAAQDGEVDGRVEGRKDDSMGNGDESSSCRWRECKVGRWLVQQLVSDLPEWFEISLCWAVGVWAGESKTGFVGKNVQLDSWDVWEPLL